MTKHTLRRYLPFCAVALVAASSASARDLVVDCDHPSDSVERALERFPGEPLRIEIFGICQENVIVERDRVELLAGEPGAGIQTPENDGLTGTPLLIRGADDILVSGLALSGGLVGVELVQSGPDVTVEDTTFANNANGVSLVRSNARLDRLQIVADFSGIAAQWHSSALCSECDLATGDLPVLATEQSSVVLAGSQIANSLSAENVALFISDGSYAELIGTDLIGGIQAEGGSSTLIHRSSTVGGSPFATLSFRSLARGFVSADSAVAQLLCQPAGDVICEAGATVGANNGCASCP